MSLPHLAVVSDPLSLETLVAGVAGRTRTSVEGCGAVSTFTGIVRATHKGRAVRYLEYEAFVPLALKVFQQIEDEIGDEWPDAVLGLIHRIGRMEVGEASVIIATGAAHRDAACASCRYAIERVKQIAPVWKHEFFEDGHDWVEGALADPADARARQAALERSCG